MRLSDFEAFSFDCYGTLIDWEAGIAAVLGPWARRNGADSDDDRLLAAYAAEEARSEAAKPGAPYPEILADSFRALGRQLGYPVGGKEAADFGRSVPDWPAFPDSHDALESLGRRAKLIVLSNVDRASFASSQARLGVGFDAVVTAEDVGAYKPSPANFEALMREALRLGVGEGKLVHVAQSLFHDHVPAKAVGLPTVWVNRGQGRPGWGATPPPPDGLVPDWELPSMAALAAAVAAGGGIPGA
ncbi:MAG: haloacid dehalogenase type II [Acidimicrobiales bacterium]